MRHSSDGVSIDMVVLGLLRDEGGLVLVQQQGTDDAEPFWVLPGGLVESGELITDALRREVREEAGAEVLSIGQLACVSQLDRPRQQMQTVTFIFEVPAWQGTLQSADPDGEILQVERLALGEALLRLEANGGWPSIQGPMRAYLRGEVGAGAAWFYRESGGVQELVTCVRPGA